MLAQRVALFVALALVLGVPFLMRPPAPAGPPGEARKLIIVTPHVAQIRQEFGEAFAAWHARTHPGEPPVIIDWRTPGGTTEIVRQLQAMFSAETARILAGVRAENPALLADASFSLAERVERASIPVDLMFGGGSFDHGRLKDGATAAVWVRPFARDAGVETVTLGPRPRDFDPRTPGDTQAITVQAVIRGQKLTLRVPIAPDPAIEGGVASLLPLVDNPSVDVRLDLGRVERQLPLPISAPAGFTQEQLDAWYGENTIGAQRLYDPDQHWLGTALSSFGIVYSRDVFARLGLPEPRSFADLGDPRLSGWVALADPRQSGSITTAFESVLSINGWDRGWRILRDMAANARYFTNSSTKPPIDVSQGDAAAGVVIDFYGRGQAQAVLAPGQSAVDSRVGYVDPAGEVYIDADPVSIIRGGPSPDLARRFVEFCLTEEAQALWNLPARESPARRAAASDAPALRNPAGDDGRELGPRVYELRRMPVRRAFYAEHAGAMMDKVDPFALAGKASSTPWRSAIGIMMGAFAIDNFAAMRQAWDALNAARTTPGFPPEVLAQMEETFYAWPVTTMPSEGPGSGPSGEPTEGAAPARTLPFTQQTYAEIRAAWRRPGFEARARIEYTQFFAAQYRRVLDLHRGVALADAPTSSR